MSGQNDDEKKLIAKRKQRQLTAEEQAAADQKAAEDLIARRIKMRNLILKDYLPFLTGDSPGDGGGALGKASHLATMQAEAIAAILIADLIILFAQLVFNTPYLIHKTQFNVALQKQLELMNKGENLQLVYMPDENGVWPTVYVVDELTKEIDYSQTYENGKAPREAVRLQGLVPKPSLKEGYWNAMNLHMERMWGNNILSESEQLKLRNLVDNARPEAQKQDEMRNRLMAQRINQRPVPKPGGRG